MITPAYAPTATERVLPRLALDFTTGVLDPRVTVSRTLNTATRTDASGLIQLVDADLPRFDYDPSTLAPLGLLVEEQRTNLFLNSTIDGANLATQNVTVTAQSYTISFYGTGTITLSGAATATITGTGAYPSRKTYTFTPSAGTLTCTVSGTVQYANCEAGGFATSYIPTTGTSVLRNADVVTMTGTNFSSWYNQSEGAFYVRGSRISNTSYSAYVSASDGTTANETYLTDGAGVAQAYVSSSGGAPGGMTALQTWPAGSVRSAVLGYKTNLCALAFNGNAVVQDTAVDIPTVNKLNIGSRATNGTLINGRVAKISYWPMRITNAELQAFSKS